MSNAERLVVGSARRASPRLASVALVAALVSSACDPGLIEVQFVWPEGRPVFAEDDPATTFVRVETRTEVHVPGPVIAQAAPHSFRETRTWIEEVPYGEDRVMIAEVRESRDADSHVLYYGLSEKFDIHFGEHIRVPVFMGPVAPPEAIPVGDGQGSLRIVTSSLAPGIVGRAEVEIHLFTDSGVTARLSNWVGLPEARSVSQPLDELKSVDGAAEGFRGYRMTWNLERDVATPCAEERTCLRQIFARFVDAQGYGSRPVVADVVLDREAPRVVPGATGISPEVASADAPIVVSLTASEVLSRAPRVWVEGATEFELIRLFPEVERPSGTYTFTSSRAVAALGRDGTFRVLATMEDLVGNQRADVELGTFRVDTPGPGLDDLEITPERIGRTPGSVVTVRYRIDERGEGGRQRVTISGRPMDACESKPDETDPQHTRVTCTRAMRGDEVADDVEETQSVQVEAFDAAGNVSRLTGSLTFDFRAPDVLPGSVFVRVTPEPSSFAARLLGTSAELERLGPDTVARLSFTLDEQPRRRPRLSTAPSALTCTVEREAGVAFTHACRLGRRPAEGPYTVALEVEDAFGNRATRVIASPTLTLTVDTTPPPAPDTLRVTHERTPWGSEATGPGAHAAVLAEAGAVEPDARVGILEEASLTRARFLGTTRADARGGFARFALDRLDEDPEVFIVVVDGAGNVSPSTSGAARSASLIRSGVWTASLGGKRLGQEDSNPHEIRKLLWTTPILTPPTDSVAELTQSELDTLEPGNREVLSVEGVRRWETFPPPLASPSARFGAAAAYDTMRGRGVMFGGESNGVVLDDTWEWNGKHWLAVAPNGRTPPPRKGASMVYDAARGRIVMFGGEGAADPVKYNDTWVFDGEAWTELRSRGPSARADAAMAYDSVTGRVLLFGGRDNAGALDDWWILDESGWRFSLRPPSIVGLPTTRSTPAARYGAAMIFDETNGSFLLVGGRTSGGALLGDAWTFTTEWRRAQLDAAVTQRAHAVMTFDPVRGTWVLYGGDGPNGPATGLYENGLLNTAGDQGTSPTGAVSFFDAALGETIIFGGKAQGSTAHDKTHAWNGVWRDRTPSTVLPESRIDHGMVYDPATGNTIIAGGRQTLSGSEVLHRSVWGWNGARWSQLAPLPSPRAELKLALWRGELCVVGGRGTDGVPIAEMLCLARGNGEWVVPPTRQPPRPTNSPSNPLAFPPFRHPDGRSGHALASTSGGASILMFGGVGSSGRTQDTWTCEDGHDWRQILTGVEGSTPSARRAHALAYDASRNRFVMFGGLGALPSNETWEFADGAWTLIATQVAGPAARHSHSMSFQDSRGRTVLYGGKDTNDFADAWEWDGTTWRLVESRRSPRTKPGAEFAYATDRRRNVLFGQDEAGQADLWELVADENERPGLLVSFSIHHAGVDMAYMTEATLLLAGAAHGNTTELPGIGRRVGGLQIETWDATRGAWVSFDDIQTIPSQRLALSLERKWLSSERRLHLRLSPRMPAGNGATPPHVELNHAEYQIRYRLP